MVVAGSDGVKLLDHEIALKPLGYYVIIWEVLPVSAGFC